MSENNNADATTTTNEGAKGPKVVKHIDVRIEELEAKIKELGVKLADLKSQKANAAKFDTVVPGLTVKFGYGRAEKRRTLEGVVTAREGDNIAIAEGSGLDARILRATVQDVIFPEDSAVQA